MKISAFPFIAALFVLTASINLSGAGSIDRRFSSSFGEITLDQVAARVSVNGDLVTRGTSRVMASLRLGSPSAVLADGTWLYYNYTARIDRHDAGHAGTLVLRFVASEVSSLTLADKATVIALRAMPRRTLDKVLTAERK